MWAAGRVAGGSDAAMEGRTRAAQSRGKAGEALESLLCSKHSTASKAARAAFVLPISPCGP